jgi:uncharacterized protein YutE (UPF0331/DUF86 family)
VVDRDIVTAKIAAIERCLSRITEVRGERRSALLPVDVDDITALNLQRAVQAAIDLASHVVAAEGYGLPATAADAFGLLAERGILGGDLAERLRRMVGFRNVAIHEYQELDPEIVESIVQRHLGDLQALGALIVEAFGLT